MENKCYWCGGEATTKDHCPPDNLFLERGLELVTVPSCKKHNNDLSNIDDEIGQYLKAISCNSKDINILNNLEKMKRGNKKLLDKLIYSFSSARMVKSGVYLTIKDGSNKMSIYLSKITRGLFYKHFKCIGNKNFFFTGDVLVNINPIVEEAFKEISLLPKEFFIDGDVPYPNVFNYNYRIERQGDRGIFLVNMKFYNTIGFKTILQF